ncbi:MAG TPA: hypothetical protein VMT30_09125 [Candidatus Saccharimonadia bacterium]|nr:hypothetical protein [Candidatus Saccharimonadia bacterium]
MPKKPGLRDDDVLGRLADLERRQDAVEETITERVDPKGSKRPPHKTPADEE